MRITIPVSGDGYAWLAHLPEVNFDPTEMLDDGKLVMPKVVDLFKRANDFSAANGFRQTFTSASDDGFNVYSMTIEFLRQLSAVTKWLESRPESKAHVSSNNSPQDRRLERRMSRDQVAFCRIDVTNVAGGVRILIGYANPKQKVVGNCASGAKECAVYLARIALNMAETINALDRSRNAGLRVFVEGRDPDLVPLARDRERDGRERDRIREANERRVGCENRHGAYCSPSNPNCRCYRNGRCVEAVFEGND